MTPAIADHATIKKRLAEIEAERQKAIAGEPEPKPVEEAAVTYSGEYDGAC